ncbi:MAG TPA: bacteriohopanetetrol glucosamine biosynthesis glycosyltransferase HpnI [Casimicrobiaceae bacterium]|nr:bacteriohopanetetrol glucosamine biosynthesis glycosyltransferase HpnI [Casimicrobiaceae bacterium]
MADTFSAWLGAAGFVLAAAGCVYVLGAALAVRRFAGDSGVPATAFSGVSILKPLSGATPGLYEDLASFCDQDYPGPLQILFGVQDPDDAAVALVERLIAERPGRDLELVARASAHGPNPKIANLSGLERRIRHEVVIIADADIAVPRDYLQRTVAALHLPEVGAVTVLYRGVTRGGLWAQLATMGIDYHFLPSVMVGIALGLARPCFGSTIALRRETLAAIGGVGAVADRIADDYAIGAAVRGAGMKVAIPSMVLEHTCSERTAMELLRHELRWARTVRAVNPVGYAGLIVAHPLPFAILAAALAASALGMAMIAMAVGARLVLQLQVDHTLGLRSGRAWLGPARDLLAFGVYVASFFVNVVDWRGRRYRVRSDGTLIALGEPKA